MPILYLNYWIILLLQVRAFILKILLGVLKGLIPLFQNNCHLSLIFL